MAVAVELSYESGVTLDDYYEILERLGARPGGPHPDPGCLFHWVAQVDGAFRAVDVWESREQFEQYVQNRLMPVAADVGVTQEPRITFTEVASYHTAGRQ
jgi:hypothetical protein